MADKEEKSSGVSAYNVSSGEKDKAINLMKVVDEFGCQLIDKKMVEEFEEITGKKAHTWIRRGLYFAHRDFDKILKMAKEDVPFYLYTGRGPSGNMHLGHLIPFFFTKYLQETFKCPLVIQITDDEKYFMSDKFTLEELTEKYAIENLKDIIACGFDPERTFIFMDTKYIQQMYPVITKIRKVLTLNNIKGCFGFSSSENLGKWSFAPTQMCPSFNDAFKGVLPDVDSKLKEEKTKKKDKSKVRGLQCFIPCGIDQDPYFRLTRDVASKLNYRKPASIMSGFIPGLQGVGSKMSTSVPSSAIFLTDTPKQIKKKINGAFSGGKINIEEHRKHGANIDIDISIKYLEVFMDDDEKLEEIKTKYAKGEMLSGEVKAILIEVIQKMMKEFQDRRAKVTDEVLAEFLKIKPLKFKNGVIADEKKEEVKEKKKKKKKGKGKSPFDLFKAEKMPLFEGKEEYMRDNNGKQVLDMKKIGREIGMLWKKMSSEDKKKYLPK